jgi:type IV pilus assembly protein PilP
MTPQAKTADTPKAGATKSVATEIETAPAPDTETEETAEALSLRDSIMDDTAPKYDPTGKTDPFAALFSKENTTGVSEDMEPKRPLTPLEKIDLSQLQLVAVLKASSGSRAMVEDATGKGYVLMPGTFVGLNSGVVTEILKDRVIIEEKAKDFLGRESTGTKELKLQKPFGEE